jgi:hypothetical protein
MDVLNPAFEKGPIAQLNSNAKSPNATKNVGGCATNQRPQCI